MAERPHELSNYKKARMSQGSDTRVRTQKKPTGFFLGKPTLKTPVKKPGPRQANFDVIFHSNKEILIFTRLKES